MTQISDLLPRYGHYLTHERGLAAATVTAYLSDLRRLARFTAADVEAVDRDALRAFMRHLSVCGYATSTIRRTFHGFGTFWAWLRLEHVTEADPLEALRLPRQNRRAPAWLSEAELRRFATTPVTARWESVVLRDTLAWGTLAWLGLRRQELLALQVGDVRLADGVIVVKNTKSKQDRTLAIPAALQCPFSTLCEGRSATDYVFGRRGRPWGLAPFNRAFKRHLRAAGLEDRGVTPHTLRHSFATHLILRGVALHVVKELLGHKDMASTQVYLHADPQHLRDALAKHPLMEEK